MSLKTYRLLPTKNRRRQHVKPFRTGAVAVEFSIVATLFFLLLMSIFEFGWLTVIRHTADNAAYEAARVAIVPGASAQDAVDEANRILTIVGTRDATVSIIPDVINQDTQEVEVVIEIPTNSNGLIATKILRNIVFRSNCRLLTERPRQ